MTQPCRRDDWFAGLVASRLAILLAPLAAAVLLALAAAFAVGGAEPGLWAMALRSLAVSAALVWAFVGVGVCLSALARTPERATVYALTAWLVVVALHDFVLIGMLLQAHLPPRAVFTLAALNPVESARVALLASADPELSVLGPVGFWLAHAFGPGRALAVGVGWPLVLGSAGVLAARRRLGRLDLTA
jgi:ABC-2 type transport system permease protein